MLSFCTDCPLPTLSVYTATKAALRSLSAGMRMELGFTSGLDVVVVNPGDHPSATPLCSGPAMVALYDKMEKHLENNCRDFDDFKEYFQGCRSKFTTLFPPQPLRSLPDPGFYSTFSDLLTARRPLPEYVNSPLGTRAFFAVVGWMPVRWADAVRIAMMKLPKV